MIFEPGNIYHIYNQGNNRQTIFFCRDNYLFFLRKVRQFLLPHVEMLAWCLMPNHFHLMVYVKKDSLKSELNSSDDFKSSDEFNSDFKPRTLNQSIAILLRSYTRAINKAQNRTGSLFRPKTKSECITKYEGITPSFYKTQSGTVINTHDLEKEYPYVCFNYIHNNPVAAGLVQSISEWEFSSFADYYNKRNGNLINRERAKEFGCILT